MKENEAIEELNLQSIVLGRRVKANRNIEEFVSSCVLKHRKNAVDIAIQALEEIQSYRAIGTIEEFKALKEKSEAKQPLDGGEVLGKICPTCGRFISKSDNLHYCICGQKLDWNELKGNAQ